MVAIDFSHDLLPDLLIAILKGRLTSGTVENCSQLIPANLTISIFVEHIEGDSKVVFVKKAGAIHCSCDELTVVDLTVAIRIKLVDQVVPVLAASAHHSQHLAHARL